MVTPLQSILDTDSARVYFAKSVRQTQNMRTVQATKARSVFAEYLVQINKGPSRMPTRDKTEGVGALICA